MGGILFYYDENLNRGLVVAQEDIGNAPWGCLGFNVNGLNSSIGSGLNNSILITQQCDETPNAAQLCLEYESNGYSDWYLPSYDELLLMWSSVGQGAQHIGNVSDFNDAAYWSSNEAGAAHGNCLYFSHSNPSEYVTSNGKGSLFFLRPIRSFGNWTMGCIDETACNYNSEANMDDGSCEYAEQGYDCEGNINVQVGDEAFGGIVFYVDETGQHGLVAALEDIEEVPFGCFGEGNIIGADGIEIGTGYQNTLDIVAGCSETPIAASLALEIEINGFDDWFIPSQDELNLMYTTIGNGSSENIGGFVNEYYWSSTNYGSGSGYDLNFTNGVPCGNCFDNAYLNKSRPIRAFGNWTMGCMDSLACNFNSQANMEEGSCNYAQEGYDCEGNELFQIDGFIYIGKYNGNDYYLSEGLSYWEEANLICNENEGHLVTISDNDENMFISNALINSQTDNLTFENWELRCEIGLKKIDGQWTWVTGEPVDFTKWSLQTNEPSGDGNCAHTNHDIYHPNYGSNYFGYWNDHSCNSGETRFILEIEN